MLNTPKKRKYQFAIFIGRFQPFHNAHLKIALNGLELADHLIMVIGSHACAPSTRNPWTSEERSSMIHLGLPPDQHHRVTVAAVRDYLYNDNIWLRELQNQVNRIIRQTTDDAYPKVILIGHHKDDTSYYLNLFPQWKFQEESTIRFDAGRKDEISGTQIRHSFFTNGRTGNNQLICPVGDLNVPPAVQTSLEAYRDTQDFLDIQKEFEYLTNYKNQWRDSPFPPTFNTTDAVVIRSGHVLIVKRGRRPGKGQYALPGGFLNQRESIVNGMLRELAEETNILVHKDDLRKAICDQRVFDHPERSARGRILTHAFCLNLGDGELPKVSGADDADEALWMSLLEVGVNERCFFEDHLHIIQYFTNKF